MGTEIIGEILNTCIILEQKAYEIYKQLSQDEKDPELKSFWEIMRDEEKEHTFFWKELLKLKDEDIVAQAFTDTKKIKKELMDLDVKIDELVAKKIDSFSLNDKFILAFRMESFLLHSAIINLFDIMKTLPNTIYRESKSFYEEHLERFITMLEKYSNVSIELELLGEILRKLWHENRELADQSHIDFLTGKFNRRGFSTQVQPLAHLSKRYQYSIGLMMIDIDNLKEVNDEMGHKEGDRIIKVLADAIDFNIRGSDVMGRYGGDEFIVFFTRVNKEELTEISDKIRTIINKKEINIPVSVSIGICQGYLKDNINDELESYIQAADKVLYEAKNTGGNKSVICNCLHT